MKTYSRIFPGVLYFGALENSEGLFSENTTLITLNSSGCRIQGMLNMREAWLCGKSYTVAWAWANYYSPGSIRKVVITPVRHTDLLVIHSIFKLWPLVVHICVTNRNTSPIFTSRKAQVQVEYLGMKVIIMTMPKWNTEASQVYKKYSSSTEKDVSLPQEAIPGIRVPRFM